MRIRRAGLLAIVAALTVATDGARAGAQPVRLADGDSFSLGNERYRLYGIDAPELNQQCTDAGGRAWPCGARARAELRRLIGSNPVQCRTVATDRFGRHVAVCHAGGRDLSEEMVRAGYATIIERRGFANPYEAAQAEARAGRRGLWAGSFDTPSDWRRAKPRDDDRGPPPPTPRAWLAGKAGEIWQTVSGWMRSLSGREQPGKSGDMVNR
jgi:endonuclease YncB( thermonuclease family)